MRDVRVCAACLATDVRMYSMSAASLLEPYRLLTGIESLQMGEGMPQKLCWECAALVHKFNMFRHKCERASLLLQDIYKQHDEVSEQEVLRVNREQHKLISSYTICPIEVYDTDFIFYHTKRKNFHKDETYEAKKTNSSQTDNATMEPCIKLELDIVKKEEVPIEMKSESDDTELIDDIYVEGDCSRAVHLESPQTIQHVIKRSHIEPKQKSGRKAAKDFGMKEELLSQEQQMEAMREKGNTEVYKSARFPCTLCYIHFSEEKAFNNHMLKHDPVSGEFICDLCKLRYKTRLNLRCHILSHHMKRYSCQSCPRVFSSRTDALRHYAWHKGVVYTCHVCLVTFKKKTTYQDHLRSRHSSEHVCDQCGEQYHTKKGLLQHINMTHKIKRDTVASGGEQETSGPYCAECDIQFTCKQAWTKHILISPKHQHERHICALGCATCGETLLDEESLLSHRGTHRRTKVYSKPRVRASMVSMTPITCEQCGEVMTSSRLYHVHFQREHRDKTRTHYPAMRTPCICELCGKVFQTKSRLKEHSYKHTGERPYKCDVCSKTFTMNSVLHVHLRSHTKELPYICNICGRGFSLNSSLTRHMTVHTDAKPCRCETCGKCFKSRRILKTHGLYVHMKKPWPKTGDRSKRQNGNERTSRGDKRKLPEHS